MLVDSILHRRHLPFFAISPRSRLLLLSSVSLVPVVCPPSRYRLAPFLRGRKRCRASLHRPTLEDRGWLQQQQHVGVCISLGRPRPRIYGILYSSRLGVPPSRLGFTGRGSRNTESYSSNRLFTISNATEAGTEERIESLRILYSPSSRISFRISRVSLREP